MTSLRTLGVGVGAAITLVLVIGFSNFRDVDGARRSRGVAEMASHWDGHVQFEDAFSPLNPFAAAGGDVAAPAASGFDANDQFWGLPRNPGYEDVAYTCSACHSLQLVMQQKRSAARRNELIDWMISQQGMPRPAATDRERIVSYLAKNFGEESAQPVPQ